MLIDRETVYLQKIKILFQFLLYTYTVDWVATRAQKILTEFCILFSMKNISLRKYFQLFYWCTPRFNNWSLSLTRLHKYCIEY